MTIGGLRLNTQLASAYNRRRDWSTEEFQYKLTDLIEESIILLRVRHRMGFAITDKSNEDPAIRQLMNIFLELYDGLFKTSLFGSLSENKQSSSVEREVDHSQTQATRNESDVTCKSDSSVQV